MAKVIKEMASITEDDGPPAAKRIHLSSRNVSSDADHNRSFTSSSAVDFLEDILRVGCVGDGSGQGSISIIQRYTQKLQEFTNQYLCILNESEHMECVSSLVRISSSFKLESVSAICFQNIVSIFERSRLKSEILERIMPIIVNQSQNSSNFLYNSADPSIVLVFVKVGLRENLLSSDHVKFALDLARDSIAASERSQRIAAITLLIALLEKRDFPQKTPQFLSWLEGVLLELADDRDARIRTMAVNGIFVLSKAETSLGFNVYELMKKLIFKTGSDTKIEALHVLKILASRRPGTPVKSRSGVKLRIIDDAFAAVCHAVTDPDATVRAEAARLLGLFEGVSDSFLDQTLDKKLLNSMCRKNESQIKPQRMYFKSQYNATTSHSWSTGKRLGEDVPAEGMEEERTSLIPIGSCGAFVTALEDEFMIVRKSGIYSLGRLAIDRPFFAAAVIDHLSDMFNDEIEEVRLDAVKALTPLVVHGVLQKEQLNTILTVLDDASPDSREALRDLLGMSTLLTVECLKFSVDALLNCMTRFPIDRSSIYTCLSKLGSRHAQFVQPLVTDLLSLHPVYDIAERSLNDILYVAKLILIFNAAKEHEPICSLLPELVVKHYKYLHCSMSDVVPRVSSFFTGSPSDVCALLDSHRDSAVSEIKLIFLERCYEVLAKACLAESHNERTVLRNLISKDLKALHDFDEAAASTAQFLLKLLDCLSLYDSAVQKVVTDSDFSTCRSIIEAGLSAVDNAENEFHSVDEVMLTTLAECAFRLRVLRCSLTLEIRPSIGVHETYAYEIDLFQRRLKSLRTSPSGSVLHIIGGIDREFDSGKKKLIFNSVNVATLLMDNLTCLPDSFTSLGKIIMKWAEIVEPYEVSSEPMRFIGGLPLELRMNIILHHFEEDDIKRLRIKVDYPNKVSRLHRPRRSEFKQITSEKTRLISKVLLISGAWSDSARVRLSCALLVNDESSESSQATDGLSWTIGGKKPRCILISSSPHSWMESSIDVPIYPMLSIRS